MSQPQIPAVSDYTISDPGLLGPPRSSADRFMRRLLRLPVDEPKASADLARKAFQTSLAVATVRCLLMYIVFPFALPLIGIAKGVGPWIGLVISATSWIRVHVVFRQPESRRTSQIVLAWLLTPLISGISRDLAIDQRFFLLFNGGAVWRPLVPSVIVLLLSVFAWWYTARYRDSEES